MWVERLEVHDLRNIAEARFDLGPGLNVFVGRNAQGKTSLLEAVGLVARGRSFRTEDAAEAVRRGTGALRARATVVRADRRLRLEVEVAPGLRRRMAVDGREVSPREYQGRLEAAVYATDRLRVVHGPMRERRLFLDRGASALWPRYRQAVREFERVLRQRNAALEWDGHALEAWDERFVALGAELRQRRGEYVERLARALAGGFAPGGERYGIALSSPAARGEEGQREALRRQMEERRRDERRARRSLVGPHRDAVTLSVDGEDAAGSASSGQARSLLLALTLAALAVYREERGEAAVALLDDLDSELDQERTAALCREVAARGQALVTSAHESWARSLGDEARMFRVEAGRVTADGATPGGARD